MIFVVCYELHLQEALKQSYELLSFVPTDTSRMTNLIDTHFIVYTLI